jgi:hypothetical protein
MTTLPYCTPGMPQNPLERSRRMCAHQTQKAASMRRGLSGLVQLRTERCRNRNRYRSASVRSASSSSSSNSGSGFPLVIDG